MRGFSFHDPAFMGQGNLTLSSFAAFWKMNEAAATDDIVDSSGNAYDLTVSSDPGVIAGKIDGARDLESPNSATNASALLASGSFTVVGWFKFSNDTGTALTTELGTFLNRNLVCTDSNGYPVAFGDSSTTTVTENAWNFLTFGYDVGADEYFIRANMGTEVRGASVGAPTYANGVTLGGVENRGMDAVGVINRLLSESEQAWLYNSGNGRDL